MDKRAPFVSWDTDKVDEELREFFPDYDYKGVMIDIGAYHSRWKSSSWHFEKSGWLVVCIEANPECIEELKNNRQHVLHYAAFSKNILKTLVIYNLDRAGVGHQASYTGLEGFNEGPPDKIEKKVEVEARTLDWILTTHFPEVDSVDIVSIDVEGAELEVLKGFDIKKWSPKVLVVENRHHDEQIINMLKSFGYKYRQGYRHYNEYYYI